MGRAEKHERRSFQLAFFPHALCLGHVIEERSSPRCTSPGKRESGWGGGWGGRGEDGRPLRMRSCNGHQRYPFRPILLLPRPVYRTHTWNLRLGSEAWAVGGVGVPPFAAQDEVVWALGAGIVVEEHAPHSGATYADQELETLGGAPRRCRVRQGRPSLVVTALLA